MSFSLLGTKWTPDEFDSYVQTQNMSWASSITIHHTGYPNLSMRKAGLIVQHVKNIASYYKSKGWSRGPHLFTDDVDINGMSPLTERGIHAKSFNRNSIGIEVLGNYDKDDPHTGRGKKCWDIAAKTTASILKAMGLKANKNTIKFHRDDPRTSKSCPGNKIDKDWFIEKVQAEMLKGNEPKKGNMELESIQWQLSQIQKEVKGSLSSDQSEEIKNRLDSIEWQAKKLNKSCQNLK